MFNIICKSVKFIYWVVMLNIKKRIIVYELLYAVRISKTYLRKITRIQICKRVQYST